MLTTFRYSKLRFDERKWAWIVTYNFARKENLNSLLLESMLKSIFHWKAHFLIIVRSLFNSRSYFLKSWYIENKDVSSVNILQINWIPSGKSWIHIKKRSSPRTNPFGTPERTFSQEELWPLTIYKLSISLRRLLEITTIWVYRQVLHAKLYQTP